MLTNMFGLPQKNKTNKNKKIRVNNPPGKELQGQGDSNHCLEKFKTKE